jgi:pyrroloquinoline quinone (PQQ) biosynthesis protein C
MMQALGSQPSINGGFFVVISNSVKVSRLAKTLVNESLERIGSHPFIRDAIDEKLTKDQVRRWLMCAGRESRIFPKVVGNMVARCKPEHKIIAETLSRNLQDELGNGDPHEAHFQHYVQLLRAVGICQDEFAQYEEKAGIKLALELAYNVSKQEDMPVAIGYLLVNEGMTPVTYSAVGRSMWQHYQFSEIPFLEVHVSIDAGHVAALYDAVDQLAPSDLPQLRYGIGLGERGMSVLLDEAYGVFESDR